MQADTLLWLAQTVPTREALGPARTGGGRGEHTVQPGARAGGAPVRRQQGRAARAQVDAPAARYRSLARVRAEPAPGSASFTQEALQAWREACSGPHFLAAAAALTPLTQTLPQLLHHQARWAQNPAPRRPRLLAPTRSVSPLQSEAARGVLAEGDAGAGPVLRAAVPRARPQPRRR